MDVRIQSIHFDASEQLQAFIQKESVQVGKVLRRYKESRGVIKGSKSRKLLQNKEAGIKILNPHGEFYASKVCDTFEEAIDLDVEALVATG